jgi:hypothetical protein
MLEKSKSHYAETGLVGPQPTITEMDVADFKKVVVDVVRIMARDNRIIQISDDRFSLPGHAHRYRTLDDFWEA